MAFTDQRKAELLFGYDRQEEQEMLDLERYMSIGYTHDNSKIYSHNYRTEGIRNIKRKYGMKRVSIYTNSNVRRLYYKMTQDHKNKPI